MVTNSMVLMMTMHQIAPDSMSPYVKLEAAAREDERATQSLETDTPRSADLGRAGDGGADEDGGGEDGSFGEGATADVQAARRRGSAAAENRRVLATMASDPDALLSRTAWYADDEAALDTVHARRRASTATEVSKRARRLEERVDDESYNQKWTTEELTRLEDALLAFGPQGTVSRGRGG